MNERNESYGNDLRTMIKSHVSLFFYILQILFILMYIETEVQPFVYVRF